MVASKPPPVIKALQVVSYPAITNSNVTTTYQFDIMAVLEKCLYLEYQIPTTLEKYPEKVRILSKNTAFKHYRLDLCMWKHINRGECWLNDSDVKDPDKLKLSITMWIHFE